MKTVIQTIAMLGIATVATISVNAFGFEPKQWFESAPPAKPIPVLVERLGFSAEKDVLSIIGVTADNRRVHATRDLRESSPFLMVREGDELLVDEAHNTVVGFGHRTLSPPTDQEKSPDAQE